jgi:2,3-dihydroxybiphenyl 1,2-dioxygenase
MGEISSLGYVVFKVSDLAKWEDFGTNILGMMVGRKGKDFLGLRMDEYAQRILLEQGPDDDIAAAGWQFDTGDELDEYVARLREAKVEVREGDAERVANRLVDRLYVCDDPNGFEHEFYVTPTHAPISAPFRSPLLKGDGFQTGRLGIGHIFHIARDYAKSIDFYKNVMGLRVSDFIRDSQTFPGLAFEGIFFHTRTGRHHSLATASLPHPKRLHHLMVELKDMDDVGLAFDRCVKADIKIHSGLGHHPNDHMFSFYLETPSGFGLEYGYGGVVIDDATWEIKNYSQTSDWGHRPPARPNVVA